MPRGGRRVSTGGPTVSHGPHLDSRRTKGDGKRREPVRGENPRGTRGPAKSPPETGPPILTSDQKVGGSSPSGRALKAHALQGLSHDRGTLTV